MMSPETHRDEQNPTTNESTKTASLVRRLFSSLLGASQPTYEVLPDISHFTGVVNMDVMATNTDAVIIKCLDGTAQSRYFVENYTGAKAKGIKVSAYQWLYPGNKISIRKQAQTLTDLLEQYPVDFGPFIDFEWTNYGGNPANPGASDLYGMLEYFNEMNDYYPGIYTAKGYWDQYGNTEPYWKDKILWVANYGVSSPAVPSPWTSWTLWQYTPSGPAQKYGVDPDFQKAIDLNRFNGTREEYLEFINKESSPGNPPDQTIPLFDGAVLHKIRRFKANCFLLVLDVTKLDTVVTPPDVGDKHYPRTVSQFVEQFKVKVAVNGDGFNYVGDMVKVVSLNASSGKKYGEQLEDRPVINFSKDNLITFIWKNLGNANLWNAVAGDRFILENGEYNSNITDPSKEPRTSAGKAADDKLVLLVADGRQPGITEGLTFPQVAAVMREFNVLTAINLDGGSSSTMYADGKVQNVPVEDNVPGRESAVANHLGFRIKGEVPVPPNAKYSCEVINYFNKKLSVRKDHSVTSPSLYTLSPGAKFFGYEIYVEEPNRRVWMSTEDGWTTVLWPNKEQEQSGVGTTERVKYTLIDQPPSNGKKVVSVLLTYDDGSTQEFVPKEDAVG
jgi:GH25 family lysozyme M1 (1,4-beta-N-acetylmuramidase)